MTKTANRSSVVILRLIGTWIAASFVWYAMAMLVGTVVWYLCHGRLVLGPYGRDKSLSNLVIELPAVLILTTAVFPFTGPRHEGRWWPRAAWIIIIVAALVALVVPGLPE